MSLGQRISGAVAVLRGTSEVKEAQTSTSDEIEKITTVEEEKICHKAITPLDRLERVVDWFRENMLLVFTIAAVLVGLILGFLGRLANPTPQSITLISFPGELLMRLLKMFILPLIVSSLISGMAQLDPKGSGRMGYRALLYYTVTTILAAIVGIVMVLIIHPGDPRIKSVITAHKADYTKISTLDAILDIIRNMVPENLVQACFQQAQTTYVTKEVATGTASEITHIQEATLVYKDGTNVMGMIVFCITFGLVAGQFGAQGKLIVDFFMILNEIIMKLVGIIIMWYSPFGIMCLIAGKIMSINNLTATAQMLGLYMVTVILGLLFHALITLPTIFWFLTRQNPAVFFRGMMQAWMTALGTASSAATLPITFRCLEENNKIDSRVTRFVVAVGATVCMIDSTEVCDYYLFMDHLHLRSFTATLASIGAASIPSAALITMLIVLTALGLPTNDISLLFAVDWMLDRIRTSINVLGDGYGAGIVYHLSKAELDKMDQEKKLEGLEMGTPLENILESCQQDDTLAPKESSETKI
ncbi:Excitatory amino acid transporter [Apis cerana cerana]|uniref:Amino acid transporter n=1 Tax=Apis cerana cerana TaxID=94128 RepID=A0A2A3ES75_APICC|nr:Excitatory amino acid transporter [Apis cerana cerana]